MKRIVSAGISLALLSTSFAQSSLAATSTKKPTPVLSKKALPTTAKKATPVVKKRAVIAKKKIVKKYIPRKKVKLAPSPKATWPPKNFKVNNGIYARIPTGNELIALLSDKSTLRKIVNQCESNACAAVFVASDAACTYWEINSTVNGPKSSDVTQTVVYGSLRTLIGPTKTKNVVPIFLLSSETLIPHAEIILATLGLTKSVFYTALSQGKNLTQISGSKINAVVKALMAFENQNITDRLSRNEISIEEATAQQGETPARVSTEITAYNLTFTGISAACFSVAPSEIVPSNVYTPTLNR